MSCYFPNKGWFYGKTEKGKKQLIKLTSSSTEECELDGVVYPEIAWPGEVINIPCGQCAGCRMDYAHQWADRLMLEMESYKNDPNSCHFITLTIDDNYIDRTGYERNPKRGELRDLHVLRPVSDPDSGLVIGWSHSVSVRDLQLFIKRLRKQHPNDKKIRYFACSEYGEKSLRPHYHLIVFGLHLADGDLIFYKKSPRGDKYYNSKSIEKIWPYGYNVVADVTWESCCYVARYMMKKQKGESAQVYADFNIEEPRSFMSRRPGLAHEYYENHPMDTFTSSIVLGTEQGSRSFLPPRYLEKLFEFEYPEKSERRKELRKISAISKKNLVARKSDLSFEEYNKMLYEKFQRQMKTLDSFKNL